MIYFIQQGDDGPIKVGFAGSRAAVDARLKAFQTGHSQRLRLLCVAPGTKFDEAALHQRFAPARLRGEWFEPVPELVEWTTSEVGPALRRSTLRWRDAGLIDDSGFLTRCGQVYLMTLEDLAVDQGVDIAAGLGLIRNWAAQK